MKKLLLVVLAAVGLASCVQTEELAVANNKEAIAFDTFVENVTKTFYNTGNLNHFKVYGTISKNGAVVTNIFPGVDVTNETGVWAYGQQYTQYWIPGFTYDFTAIVDGEVAVDANGMPTSIEADMTEQEDILYATVGPRYFGTNQTAETVSFQFAHLLSKAKFTVKNTISANPKLVYNIESVTITNADATATYNVANHVWSASGTYPADFGVAAAVAQGANTVGNEVLLVPGTKELAIAIKYNLTYNNAVLVDETKNLTAVLTLEQGKAYNFVVEFGNPGEDIKFDAQVKDWTEGGIVTPGTSYVANAEEFTTAIAADGIDRIVLAGDLDLTAGGTRVAADPSFVIANGKELTIELGGHKLSAASTASDKNFELFLVKGNLTVSNGTIEYVHNGTNMGWSSMTTIFDITAGGVVNLNGVTAKNLGGSDMAFVAHLNNWGEVTLNVDNESTLESPYVAVRVFNSGYDMNNVTIKNSTLNGGNYALWVHNYTVADFGTEAKAEAQKALLNFNFEDAAFVPNVNGVRYGFTNSVKADINGITHSISEDGTEVTLGSIVENGVVRRGVVGTEENSTIKKVVVGEGITTLYDRTFRRFYALEEVILPNGLTTIGAAGSGVFQSCTNLKNIVIPESVTVLGEGTFQECTSLESINIPAGVTRIEKNVFRNTGLTSVEFHADVTYFGNYAFRDCEELTEITINAPSFTVESDTFLNAAGPFPAYVIKVANAEMKAYLESRLSAHQKTFITVVSAEVTANNAVEFIAAVNNIVDGGTVIVGESFDFTKEEGGRTNNGGWWDGLGYSGDKSFTIDLNGKTVGDADGALNDYLFWFKNDGEKPNTITITNGTLDAGTKAYCALATASSNKQTITINLENVNLINNNTSGAVAKIRAGAVLNVKAGTKITGKNSYTGIECVGSTTNIYEGAEIYQNGTSSSWGFLAGASWGGVINVYGGKGVSARGGFMAMTSGGTVNVHGGEWTANVDGTIGNNSNLYVLSAQNNKKESGYKGASIVNVTGGTFRGGMDAWVLNDVNVEKAELNISGGNFNANPTSYLKDATATENNGIWTVTK